LPARQHFCEEELRLNQRVAPSLYPWRHAHHRHAASARARRPRASVRVRGAHASLRTGRAVQRAARRRPAARVETTRPKPKPMPRRLNSCTHRPNHSPTKSARWCIPACRLELRHARTLPPPTLAATPQPAPYKSAVPIISARPG
jgi:hypothetical protein